MDDKSSFNTAPPPPSEVKIRTMKSDLNSMRASGGGAPRYENVAISGLTLDKEYKAGNVPTAQPVQAYGRYQPPAASPTIYNGPSVPETHEVGSEEDKQKQFLPMVIVIGVGVIALIVVIIVAFVLFK